MEELQTFSVLGFIIKAVNCKLVIFFFFLKTKTFIYIKLIKLQFLLFGDATFSVLEQDSFLYKAEGYLSVSLFFTPSWREQLEQPGSCDFTSTFKLSGPLENSLMKGNPLKGKNH